MNPRWPYPASSACAWRIACTSPKPARGCSRTRAAQSTSPSDKHGGLMPEATDRIVKLQAALKAEGLTALLLEPGPAMLYLTGVRWGRSERLFAAVIPQTGEPAWVLPAFEETRARELVPSGARIRTWQ